MTRRIRKNISSASWKRSHAGKPFLQALRRLERREKRVKLRSPTTYKLRKRRGSQILKGRRPSKWR